MSAWLRQHRRALAAALAGLARASGLASALVIGIALSLPAGSYALLENLRPLAGRLAPEPRLNVFLEPRAKRAEAEALGALLRADGRVAGARFVPREEALAELRGADGIAELVGALERNPLPDAYVVSAKDNSAASLDALAADLRRLPAVAHVQADADWARRLAALAGIARVSLALLAVLLGAGLVAVTFNAIRLQILTRREEIEVSRLLGAANAFIRRPFYYLGLVQGLAGGAVALAIVSLAIGLLDGEVRTLAESYGSAFRLTFLPPGDALAVVLLSAFLGWLGAALSVNRYLQ